VLFPHYEPEFKLKSWGVSTSIDEAQNELAIVTLWRLNLLGAEVVAVLDLVPVNRRG
jgi:hypothetical protein